MEGLSGMTLELLGERTPPALSFLEGPMQPRDYQQTALESIIDALADGHRGILVEVFTGAGKTVLFSMLAKACCNSKVLILAHQRELVWQAAGKIDQIVGAPADIEMADMYGMRGRVTVACTQTLLRGRYKRFLGHRLIIVDECHRQMSEGMIRMLREFQDAGGHVIGFTATPFRMDGKRLLSFYDHIAFSMNAASGIEEGWCCPIRAKIVKCSWLDTKQVRIVGKDFSADDLELIMGCSRSLHQMCLTVQKERVGPALAFLPRVGSARALAELANREYGIRAEFVCGDTSVQPEGERNRILNAFRNGEIELLTNCQVAAEGFDAPVAQTVFMFRPTRSRVLAMQIWGRVMRPSPGVVDGLTSAEARKAAIAGDIKDHARIIDITDALMDHSIVTAVDMFARDETPAEVRGFAREAAANADEPMDAADLLAQAAEKLRKAKLLEEGIAALHGRASGSLTDQEVVVGGRKKCISEYKVPLRGRFAGRTMGELDDGYIEWALRNPGIKGWQRSVFARERKRRRSAAGHAG